MRWLLSSSSLFIILRFGKYSRIGPSGNLVDVTFLCANRNFVASAVCSFSVKMWSFCFYYFCFKLVHRKYAIKIRQRFSCCRCARQRDLKICAYISVKLNRNWTDSGPRLIFKSLWINEFMCLSDDDYCLFIVNVRYNIRLSCVPSSHICQFSHSFVVCLAKFICLNSVTSCISNLKRKKTFNVHKTHIRINVC